MMINIYFYNIQPTATRVSVVSLRSRDFTGLGFNVCGNMLEGIFVKDLLHRGPASESGRIHPGQFKLNKIIKNALMQLSNTCVSTPFKRDVRQIGQK